MLLWSGAAAAIDRIVLEADGVELANAQLTGASVTLELTGEAPAVAVSAERLTARQPVNATFTALRIACAQVVIEEPKFACRSGKVSARGGPTQAIDMNAAASFDSARGVTDFEASGLAIAGGTLRFAGAMAASGWSVRGRAEALRIPQIRKLLAPWLSLPAEYSMDGRVDADLEGSGRAADTRLRIDARSAGLDFSNEAGNLVAEKVGLRLRADVRQARDGMQIETALEGSSGQALAGPVLLDFGANPLQLAARGRMAQGTMQLTDISIEQKDLLSAHATASVRLGGAPTIARARADITQLKFPAAYKTFLQIALAATDFGTLEASGTASGAVEIVDDAVARLDLRLDDLDLVDERTQFFMNDLQGELHWVAGADAPVMDSTLAWSKMRAYGLVGGTARLDFRARGMGFELTREARLPVFDGAVVVRSLTAHDLGADTAELGFDADIEPISMALLSKAFGWPELAGQLSGRIPGLTYRNKVLALNGDVTAEVFDGTIVGRNFRLQDPLGPWPRLFADVSASRLDLQLVTSTFEIGSITGRLDAQLNHLELFNWSPVAFDAKLYSTPGDRSPRRISQKAVTSISSIGGGSGGVSKALQSGVLRFFEEFRYDRIGMACQLRNDVCLMSGMEPHGTGFYLVKGRGLPRIDIIGNQGRVDWPVLMSQIEAGMQSNDIIVR